MKTRCIIVDDEPLAIQLIRNHLMKIDSAEIVADCRNALVALEVLRQKPVDLMFLDIHMPQLNGLDFLSTLPHPPKVIITTAYREHALEGFTLDVVDYLLKPISFERFLKAVNKYYATLAPHTGQISQPQQPLFLSVKDKSLTYKIPVDSIYYAEGCGEYVKIYTTEKTFLSRESMRKLDQRLPQELFLRIHKSYLIAYRHITAFTSSHVKIQGKELPIGRSYKDHVIQALG